MHLSEAPFAFSVVGTTGLALGAYFDVYFLIFINLLVSTVCFSLGFEFGWFTALFDALACAFCLQSGFVGGLWLRRGSVENGSAAPRRLYPQPSDRGVEGE